jgi:hypothetical protein
MHIAMNAQTYSRIVMKEAGVYMSVFEYLTYLMDRESILDKKA